MDNINQNLPSPTAHPPIPLATKKWYRHKGILTIIILAVITAVVSYAALNHQSIIDRYGLAGGGGSEQYAPDTVNTGQPAVIQLIVSTWGSGGPIKGRYTGVSLSYKLASETDYKTLQPEAIPLPDNYQKVETAIKQGEAYQFTIPPYPQGTSGQVQYYIDLIFDGQANRINGAKQIQVSDSGTTNTIGQGEGCILSPYTGTTTLSQLPYFSPGNEDLRGGMVCKFIINPKLPAFTFDFVGQEDNTLGKIEIMEEGNSKVIQIINNATNPNAIAPAGSKDVLVPVDANFDGYKDLPILTQCGATGNCSYNFYLYDPATNRFVVNAFLSNLGTVKFDSDKQQVTASWNSSYADWGTDTYQYQSGKYTLIQKIVSASNQSNKTITKETYSLKNGKMELTDSTTTSAGY